MIQQAAANKGISITTLSIDLAVSQQCDLLNEQNFIFWYNQVAKGRVRGLGAGPPCETWSAARWFKLSDKKGPPVLRTDTHPWGVPHLTGKQIQQTETGTILLFNTLRLFEAVNAAGGCAFIEHPAAADWIPHSASIWKLEEKKNPQGASRHSDMDLQPGAARTDHEEAHNPDDNKALHIRSLPLQTTGPDNTGANSGQEGTRKRTKRRWNLFHQ